LARSDFDYPGSAVAFNNLRADFSSGAIHLYFILNEDMSCGIKWTQLINPNSSSTFLVLNNF